MLPFKNRLTKKKDFEFVFRFGERYYAPSGINMYIKEKGNRNDGSRFGFIVSKKVSKKAVNRNKLKRWLRDIVKVNLSKISNSFDVVVVLNPKLFKSDASFQKIRDDLESLFFKAGILQKND